MTAKPSYEELAERVSQLEHKVARQKQVEEDLREREKHFRFLFDSGHDAVLVQHPTSEGMPGKYVAANAVACERLGYTKAELLNLSAVDIIAPECHGEIPKIMKTLFSERQVLWELMHITKSGQKFPVEINAQLFDLNGRLTVFTVARDVTERKRAEKEKSRLEAQLLQAYKMEALGTMASGIAHDFNNILAAIIGYATLVKDDLPESSLASANLDGVLKAGARAKELIKQILSFSRSETPERKPLQLSVIIKEALKMIRASTPTTIEIRQRIAADCKTVLADPTQIHQLLMNLCTNAVYAMSEIGVLDIGLANIKITDKDIADQPELKTGEYVRLTVSDTGTGIDKEIMPYIFDPFFTTKDTGEGTGLGLSSVHGIVKSHDGAITVESEVGHGAIFNVYFPVISEGPGMLEAEAEDLPPGTERILYVDDEEMVVDLGKQILERQGYKVTISTASMDALYIFKARPDEFDLIITDQTMPGMTGLKLAQEILQIRPDIPIIICTGYSALISWNRARTIGVRKLIRKPVNRNDFVISVRKVLDGERDDV